MLTKWFFKALAHHMAGNKNILSPGYVNCITGGGYLTYPEYGCMNFLKDSESPYPSMLKMQPSLDNSNGGVIIGTGTTPVKYSDSSLSGDLITTYNYHVDVIEAVETNGAKAVSISVRYTLTNTGTEPFTVGEIGLCGCALYPNDYPYNYDSYTKILVDRTVLEEPVTIPAGGVGQIEYTIEIPIAADPA